jgi:hypothetical protein
MRRGFTHASHLLVTIGEANSKLLVIVRDLAAATA